MLKAIIYEYAPLYDPVSVQTRNIAIQAASPRWIHETTDLESMARSLERYQPAEILVVGSTQEFLKQGKKLGMHTAQLVNGEKFDGIDHYIKWQDLDHLCKGYK